MNVREYISSGILEAYALGEVTPAERAGVEQAVAAYPEIREELRKVEATLEKIALGSGITPSPRVREKVMSQILDSQDAKVVALQPERSFWKYATAASIGVALFSSYLAFYYNQQWKANALELAQIRSENARIAEDYNVVNQKLDKIQTDLGVVSNAAFTRVIMKGTANDPAALASVYWNASTQEVYLSIQNLKEISTSNQFQLWAIVNGSPVDVGVFDTNNITGLLKMKNVSGAAAFAVTVEPRGGKDHPTLEAMQVVGSIVASPS
ncbi:MAG TPA: anti-sigma factor [Cyclobacteriaceae bacterium]|nr:anti-sigma factor [Cyclobacteriaceae bacterium]